MNANASGKSKTGTSKSGKSKRDWLAFDRSDYVGTKVILGAAVLIAVIFGIGAPLLKAVNHDPLPVSYTTQVTGADLPPGTTHDGFATMELLLMDSTLGERTVQALPDLIITVLTVAVAWLLFQLLGSIQAGEPFTSRNVRRINAIALIVGLGGGLVQLTQGFANIHGAGRHTDSGGFVFELSFTPAPLVVMLVIALVGQAFRRGVELRRDVEGLV